MYQKLLLILVTFGLTSILRLLLTWYQNNKEISNSTNLRNFIEYKISHKLNTLDPAVFEQSSFQDLLAQMETMRLHIGDYAQRLTYLLDSFTKAISSAVVLSLTFPIFLPIIAISALPTFFTVRNYRHLVYPFLLEESAKAGRITNYIKNLLSQASTSKEIAIFTNGSLLLSKLKKTHTKFHSNLTNAIHKAMPKTLAGDISQFLGLITSQGINLNAVLNQTITIGQFALNFQQAISFSQGISDTLDHYVAIDIRQKYIDQFKEFLNYQNLIKLPPNPIKLNITQDPPLIEFKNVSFKYHNSEKHVLKDFNLTIKPGEKIALVGENGAGKSTLIKLLLRFYDVSDGEILINGVNIKDVNLAQWHSCIGALFQEFIKYQFSYKENIYFGDKSKYGDINTLMKAAEKSGASQFLHELPTGIDQILGNKFEGGVELSGGQWQKIALARAFFRDASLLILDEPTSAIDAKAEFEIFERVQNLQKNKTVIIISHRFSTVRNADRILVLKDGRIIEDGMHSDLMRKNGVYAELFNIQAQGYK